MPKSKITCCVVNCHNSYKNTEGKGVRFYQFPGQPWERDRRRRWILNINRITPSGEPWEPSRHAKVCSEHFITKKKNNHPSHPDFVPTVFPQVYKKSVKADFAKFERCKTRETQRHMISKPSTSFETGEIEEQKLRVSVILSEDKCVGVNIGFIEGEFIFSCDFKNDGVSTQANITDLEENIERVSEED